MHVLRPLLGVLLAATVALAPVAADARAGASSSGRGSSSYSSMGSRGSQTYTPNGAAPIERSLTPPSSPGTSPYNAPRPSPAPGYGMQPGFAQNHPFLTGVLGGLAGSWLGSMLFGHSSYAYDNGVAHAGGFFGSLIWILLLFGLGWMGWRLLSGMATAGRAGFFGGGFGPRAGAGAAFAGGRQELVEIQLTDADFTEFGQILTEVQAAWSHSDLDRLRRFVTPEMLSYFAEQLANNQSQGVANHVENVVLTRGEPREAWREGAAEYATAWLRWSATDYTVRLDRTPSEPGYLVEGDPRRPVEAEEVWTFRRSLGGRWLLSAIQQTR